MYDLERIKKELSPGDIVMNTELFKVFSVPKSSNSKKSFFKDLERVFEIKKGRTTTEIISKKQEIGKREHKNSEVMKGKPSRNKGKFKLNTGNLGYLYKGLIVSVLLRDNNRREDDRKIIGKEITLSKLGKDFFNIDRSKRNSMEIYKSQYFKASLLWLEKTSCIDLGRTYKARVSSYIVDISTGGISYDENDIIEIDEETYKEYIECSKEVFEEHFKEKYSTRSQFEICAGDYDIQLNKLYTYEKMIEKSVGKELYGLKDNQFISIAFEQVIISLNENIINGFNLGYVIEENYIQVADKVSFMMCTGSDRILYIERYVDCETYKFKVYKLDGDKKRTKETIKLEREELLEKARVLIDFVSFNEDIPTAYSSEEIKDIEKRLLPKKILY